MPRDKGKRAPIPVWLGEQLGHFASEAYSPPWWALGVAACLTVLALMGARRLTMDTDLVNLLPRSFPSVQAVDELEERFWGMGYVAVVAQGADPETLKRFADEVAPQLEALPAIRFVDYRRPVDFFRDHALYYLDLEDLRTIRDRLEARRLYEVQSRSPLLRGVEDKEDLVKPELDFSDLREKYEARFAGQWSTDSRPDRGGYYLDPEQRMVVLLAKPARRATDVGFAQEVVEQVQALVDQLELERYGPTLRVELSGRYQKKIDQGRQVVGDLKLASVVALVLMMLYVGFHFRRPGAVVLVFVPLALGVVWTFGFAGWAFGQLNMLTGFIGAILLGLGIDHGIHLLGRYDQERADGQPPEVALDRSFARTGRAVIVAGLTTLIAFGGLGLSEFRAFHEFGIIAAVGMILVIAAYALVLPALLGARQRAFPPSGPSADAKGSRVAPPFARALPRWAPAVFWISALAATAAGALVGEGRFDYDFASLEDSDLPAFRLDKRINGILGHSQTPMVVLTDDQATERATIDALRARPEARPGAHTTVQAVASVGDLVPQGQADKQRVIEELDDLVGRIRPSWLEPEQQRRLDEVKRMTLAAPFGRADLPVEVRRQFQGPGAPPDSGFVLIFPAVSLSDGLAVRALARELRAVRLPTGEPLAIAGGAMVLADILDMIARESPVVIGLTFALVFAVLWVLLDRLRDALLCLGLAAVTLAVTAGLMPRIGLRFNYLNIVMIPVLFGIAVDGAVHLVSRLRESGDVAEATAETGRSIAGSILTTSLGFGALLLAHHPGVHSLGAVAVLGLAVNLVVCLVALPALLALASRWAPSRLTVASSGGSGTVKTAAGGAPQRWARLLATVGFAGYSPRAPGTLGALIAVPFGVALAQVSPAARAVVLVALAWASIPVIRRYLGGDQKRDPPEVVLDEFVGCLIALAFVPCQLAWFVAAFVLFRLFDILKPWPIGWIDRRASGAVPVVADDVVAGLVAGGWLLAMHRLGVSLGWWS